MENLNVTYLSQTELKRINGGGFFDAAFSVFKTVLKYSSLGGALIVGIGEGILEAVEEANEN